jgi:hypothetical protein
MSLLAGTDRGWKMDQMMFGKLMMDRWSAEARLEASGGSQQQEAVDRQRRVLRLAHSLLRWAGQGLSSLGEWLEMHGELNQPAGVERVGRSG